MDIPNEAHLLGSILSRRVTEIFVFYPTPPILTATPNGDSDGGRALGLALGSDIKNNNIKNKKEITIIKITRIKITIIKITKIKITRIKTTKNKHNTNIDKNKIKLLIAHVSTTLYFYLHLE